MTTTIEELHERMRAALQSIAMESTDPRSQELARTVLEELIQATRLPNP